MDQARNPRAEATSLLPPGYEARVLESSPPSNQDPAWYADDPTDPGETTGRVVTVVPAEGMTWSEAAEADPTISTFAAEHWLDGRRHLGALPTGYERGRRALHQIAFFAVAPRRYRATGKLGLRYTRGGFGTPFFLDDGTDAQVRVEADLLIVQAGDSVRSQPVTTLTEATGFLGIEYREDWFGFHDPPSPVGPDVMLDVDPSVTGAIGSWFGFATHVLERARRTPGAVDVGRVQLWPEHFDPAFEMGSAADGARASYGGSPGDDAHPEPYLYVAAWGDIDRSDPFWNDAAFNGASLGYRQLLEADDPYQAALAFLRSGHERLQH
jgi:hypothetical protein